MRTACRCTSPTPSGRRASPGSRSDTPGCAPSRTPTSGSRWCCRRTRPSTPASATPSASTPRPPPCCCCRRCARPGYDVGAFPEDGDELVHTLIAAGGHDVEWLTEDQLRAAVARVPLADYRAWFATLPTALQEAMVEHWGAPPGSLYVDGDDIVLAALQYGNVVLAIQPPRGFGENPIAIYHDPDLPPTPPLPRGLPLAGVAGRAGRLRRTRGRPPRQARHAGVAARQGARAVGRLRARRGARRPAAALPVHRQRPRRGDAGQAPGARHRRRPPRPADGPRRVLRRDGPARAAARRVRAGAGDGPGEAADDPRADLGARRAAPSCTTTCTSPSRPARRSSTPSSSTSTATCARSRTS